MLGFRRIYIDLRNNPGMVFWGLWIFFTVTCAVVFEDYIPTYGKYFAFIFGGIFSYFIYKVITKHDDLTDEQLLEKKVDTKYQIILWLFIVSAWIFMFWILAIKNI